MHKAMHDGKLNSVVSTSAGRLFDAVSAILGIRYENTFEGEASTALMYEAMKCKSHVAACDYELTGEYIETDMIVRDLVQRRLAGEDPRELAYRFHRLLGEAAAEFVSANAGTVRTAALSGGCYQNTLLLDITKKALENRGFNVLIHSLIPPNDGGISIGQAFYGMNKLKDGGI